MLYKLLNFQWYNIIFLINVRSYIYFIIFNGNPQACRDAGIKGFPTWIIKGQEYSGTQILEKLAEISGYTGPMNFKYTVPGRK